MGENNFKSFEHSTVELRRLAKKSCKLSVIFRDHQGQILLVAEFSEEEAKKFITAVQFSLPHENGMEIRGQSCDSYLRPVTCLDGNREEG